MTGWSWEALPLRGADSVVLTDCWRWVLLNGSHRMLVNNGYFWKFFFLEYFTVIFAFLKEMSYLPKSTYNLYVQFNSLKSNDKNNHSCTHHAVDQIDHYWWCQEDLSVGGPPP